MSKVQSASPRDFSQYWKLLPVLMFIALVGVLGWGLTRNSTILPSTLIGKNVPEFSLPPVQGRTQDQVNGQALGLANTDLVGEVSLVNVFASWCTACRAEHPLFMQLKAAGIVPIHGLNYKDNPEDAKAWLDELGDPYMRIGSDIKGRVGINWGVYGVPETFVINKAGKIVYKQVGAVTAKVLEEKIIPMIRRLQKEDPALLSDGSKSGKEKS